ncbi:MAG: glycosyltransferase [Cryomorphaceae bacterium]
MGKVKRIVIVGPAYPLRGGISHFNESFCGSLTAKGVQAEIVSFYLQYPALFFPGKTQYEKVQREVNVDIHPMLSSVNPYSWKKTAREIVGMNPDMVVIRFWLPFVGPALGTLARMLQRRGVKVVGLVDNAVPHERRPFDRSFSNWFFRHCDAFVALSRRVADDLERFAPGKRVHVHPHPIYDIFGDPVPREVACKELGLDPADRHVLFFGFVRKYKGLDLLIQAFADERIRKLGIKLISAGEFYDDRGPYLKLVEKHGLGDVVSFHDKYIPTEQVRQYFCSARIVAQPYRDATQSGVTQIAYQFGRPMLVTDVGGLAEIVPDGKAGFVTAPEPQAIADALVRFFEEDLEASFAEAAEEGKHLFSWDHFTEDFLTFADEIHG